MGSFSFENNFYKKMGIDQQFRT